MGMFKALGGGLRLGLKSGKIAALLWLVSLLLALPWAVFLEETVHEYIGPSLVHDSLRESMDLAWLEEFQDEAGAVSSLVTPSRMSPAAVLDNLDLWFSGDLFVENKAVAALGILFALAWTWMSGGVLAHLNRGDEQREPVQFFAASSRYFFRFLRLVLGAGLAYFGVYRFSRWLFPKIEFATRDVSVEKTVLVYNLIAAGCVIFLLVLVKLSVDYAKISTVVEERRSMLFAGLRGVQFVVTHPVRTLGVYVGMGVLGMALAAAYLLLSPGVVGGGTKVVILAMVMGQMYLLLRWTLRISLLGAESVVYRSIRGYMRVDASRF